MSQAAARQQAIGRLADAIACCFTAIWRMTKNGGK